MVQVFPFQATVSVQNVLNTGRDPPNLMLKFYFTIFWIPLIASAILLFVHWNLGDFTPRSLLISLGWCASAVFLQFFARSTPLWAAGLTLQAGLAIYLAVRLKLTL